MKEKAIRTHSNGSGKNEQNNGGLYLFYFMYVCARVYVCVFVCAYFVSSRAQTTQRKNIPRLSSKKKRAIKLRAKKYTRTHTPE